MSTKRIAYGAFAALTLAAFTGMGSASAAALLYDQDVTPDVIFGAGNANGGFTVDRENSIELGLRAKLRFNPDNNNLAEDTFNSDGAGTYTFKTGTPDLGGPNLPGSGWATTTTPIWNFEWSVNTNFDGGGSLQLEDLTYELGIDFDPSIGTNYLTFDPIIVTSGPFPDHAFGDNSTPNGGGEPHDADLADYSGALHDFNVAQNSWNYEFFNNDEFSGFNPNAIGTYNIYLTAFNSNNDVVASTSINVVTTPIPSALALMASGLGFVGFAGRKRRKQQADPTA